jgi:putative Holliday junction resolvase|tara:strand:+ start:2666 stop:3091 length:426 start_codon:yes stop_codon:yes gene_type:complete
MAKAITALGFDYGDRSIGVAIGQSITGAAQPLKALKAQQGAPNWELVGTLIEQWQPDLLVIGFPLEMDDSEQETTRKAQRFANRLNGRFNKKVVFVDERLTTREAKSQLFAAGGAKALEKATVDSKAAQLILESYFNQLAD